MCIDIINNLCPTAHLRIIFFPLLDDFLLIHIKQEFSSELQCQFNDCILVESP